MKWTATIGFALVCVALLWVFKAGFGKDPHEVPFMLSGKPAPAFQLRSLDSGDRVTFDQFKGKPLVVNFWATWCGPCKQEHPVIEWGAREFGQVAQFIGVVFDDNEENARAYLSQHGAAMPQFMDPNSRMAVDFGCAGVPETYFIDANGVILGKHVGPIDPQSMANNVRQLAAIQPTNTSVVTQ